MTGDLIFYKYNGGGYYNSSHYTEIDGETIGVHIGKDMVGALMAPVELKSDIKNEVRTEHGSRFFILPYMSERSVTLNFYITAGSRAAHKTCLDALLEILNNGHFGVCVPCVDEDLIFFLAYQSSSSFSLTRSGWSSKLAVKCIEYRPDIREWQSS